MPSLVMLPFIQCHQTRGRAPAGGFSKPALSESPFDSEALWANARLAQSARAMPPWRSFEAWTNFEARKPFATVGLMDIDDLLLADAAKRLRFPAEHGVRGGSLEWAAKRII